MLSATNSVDDVKTYLENDYSDFGFASDALFEAAITRALTDVQYLIMYMVLGSSAYAVTAAKDKVGLSEKETYIYYAEVYYACAEFMKSRKSTESSIASSADTERLQIEGYEYEVTNGSGSSGGSSAKSTSIKEYYDKAVGYLCRAGVNPHTLKKGDSIYASTDYFTIYDDVV